MYLSILTRTSVHIYVITLSVMIWNIRISIKQHNIEVLSIVLENSNFEVTCISIVQIYSLECLMILMQITKSQTFLISFNNYFSRCLYASHCENNILFRNHKAQTEQNMLCHLALGMFKSFVQLQKELCVGRSWLQNPNQRD